MVDDFSNAKRRVDAGEDVHEVAAALVRAMTLEERLDCLDGDTEFWPGLTDMTSGGYHRHPWPAAAVERLGVPGIAFVDGPRGCVVGAATCFPVSMARGATFDPALEERIGEAIGAEIRAVGGNFTGAVCLNLLRHPAWGRAQETYGEDPLHVGTMAAALTRGLQRHVLACMKHFALNSMENARFTVDVTADERALHEVYLPHFRRVAREGVASVMSAYNSVNGTWCGDNPELLTGILREEWGWDGFVITDFIFGLRDPVGSVVAGCEIEMPFRQQRAPVLADAVADGRLAEEVVDRAVTRVVATLLRFRRVLDQRPDPGVLASDAHRALAREAAAAGTVLLHHTDGVLPLAADRLAQVAVLGELAAVPNLGDGGSSDVHPPESVTPLDGLRAALPGVRVTHADRDASISAAADVTVVVVGLTRADEGEYIDSSTGDLFHLFPPLPGEAVAARPVPDPDDASEGSPTGGFSPGGDRRTLRLSEGHEQLISEAVATSRGPVVVVVMGGSAVVMPWLETTGATLQIWYPGMEGGHALADVLLGRSEPGGRLPFVLPRQEADLVGFDPDATSAVYDLFHGQWHLDRAGIEPHRPFGFGLGYTTFALRSATLERGGERVEVRATLTNTGDRDGSTVVQVFAGLPGSEWERPVRRLIGFRRAWCDAGRSCEIEIPLDLSALDVRVDGGWVTEPGTYVVEVGFSAGELPVRLELRR